MDRLATLPRAATRAALLAIITLAPAVVAGAVPVAGTTAAAAAGVGSGAAAAGEAAAASGGLTLEQLAGLRRVTEVAIAPDGSRIAYLLAVPRPLGEKDDGPARVELHVVPRAGGRSRAYVHGKVEVSRPRFTPDGSAITFLTKRGDDEHTALYAVPVDGGEARRLLGFDEDVGDYGLFPDGRRVAFLAREPEAKARKKAKEKGFTEEVFEEDVRPQKVWIAGLEPLAPVPENPATAGGGGEDDEARKPRALPVEGSVFQLDLSRDGRRLALGVAPRPLVDDRYMFQRVRVVDAETGAEIGRLENPGKLGTILLAPDGESVAMLAGGDINDPDEGRLLVGAAAGGPLADLLPGLEGAVTAIAWQDKDTVMAVVAKGVETTFGEVDRRTLKVKTHLSGGLSLDATGYVEAAGGRPARPILTALSLSTDGLHAAFVGHDPTHPAEVLAMSHGDEGLRRLTESNPWLAEVALAPQEVFVHEARDGVALQGMLLRPLGVAPGTPAPLILMVHGGPEAHDANGWMTEYGRPGQVAAARGFAVFYPNYRGSTGRGVAFSRTSQGDAAGREFEDLVDAVDDLVAAGVADPARVGVTGGSYGGYATAWCATRHSERFKAGVMFVGISNHLTKSFTTDIPFENYYSHTLYRPWTRWEHSLERSPIYWAEQSRTALLIAGGTADTRVDPGQSLQLYRALKAIGKTQVRYLRYPGEGHGNRRTAARYDYSRRLLGWFEHYLQGPGGDPPPWDLGAPGVEEDEEGQEGEEDEEDEKDEKDG